ncbi:MAG: hypothetical protein Q7O66_07425 [Dehalococcoidia bacterium]|nr:hypothetical protein [Dehalococcoidia bacterium]
MEKVVDTAEVSLFGTRYQVVRGVRPFLLNQSIAQITTGEGDPTKEEKASKWNIHNVAGGFGRYRLRIGQGDTPDKFWDSGCRTDVAGEITLPSLATEGVAMGATVTAICVGFGGYDYFFAGTVIRRFDGTNYQFYCTAHSAWETHPVTATHTAQVAPATVVSATVYNGRLYIWCTSDYQVYDGTTTWLSGAGHGGAILGTFGIEWDGNLVKVTATGILTKSTNPESATPTWTAVSTIYDAVPTGLAVYEDGNGDPAVHIGTVKGPYILDYAAGKVYRLQVRFSDSHADNCRGIMTWNGSLIFGKGGHVRQYQGGGVAQIQDMGPNQDDGLIAAKVGRVVALEASMEHMLLAAIDAGTGTSTVMKWRGQGWHSCVEADTANESIRAVGFSNITSTPRLWFGQGSSVWWVPLYDTTDNPRQQPSSTYRAAADHVTAWFDLGAARGTAIDMRLRCQSVSATETITIYYATNDVDASWNLLGVVPRNGRSTLKFAMTGKDFYSIRFKFSFARGTTNTNAPRLLAATLRWAPTPLALWGFSFEVNTAENYKGKTSAELVAALEDAAGSTMGVFSFRPNDDRYIKVEQAQALEGTGHDYRGRWAVTVSELIAVEGVLGGYFKWDGLTKWDGLHIWK